MDLLNPLPDKLQNYLKYYLIFILAFLPFQLRFIESLTLPDGVSAFLRYLDELTIVVLAPLALVLMIRSKNRSRSLDLLLLLLVTVSVVGLVSGLINRVPVAPMVLGTFDYVKNFLVIFIFAMLVPDAGFRYTDNLNDVDEAEFKFSGTGVIKRGLIELGSEVEIWSY